MLLLRFSLVPALLIFIIFAAANQAAYPRIFIGITIFLTVATIALKILRTRKISADFISFFKLTFVCLIIYMASVYQTPITGTGPLAEEYINIVLKFILGPFIFFLSYLQPWEKRQFQALTTFTLICLNLFLLGAHLSSGIVTGMVIGNLHSNFVGLFGALSLAYFGLFARNKRKLNTSLKLLGIISFTLLVLSLSRGAYITLIAAIGFYVLLGKKNNRLLIGYPLYAIVLTVLVAVSVSFSSWVKSDNAVTVSTYVEQITSKPLDTGRAKFWDRALTDIRANPLTGVGIKARASWERKLSNGSVIKLSVHNYYIAILHEAGLLGLGAVVALLLLVYSRLIKVKSHFGRYGAAWFLALLVHQTAEVSLTTGTFLAGALIWLFWGGVARFIATSGSGRQRTVFQ